MIKIIPVLTFALIIVSCNSPRETKSPNSATEADPPSKNLLSQEEIAGGWQLLFDGTTTNGWHSYGKDTLTGWAVENGELIALSLGGDLGGDIVTDEEFENFELSVEWKISPEGNSGIFFSVVEENQPGIYFTGPEYQLLDDIGFPEPVEGWQMTGANYAMQVPATKTLKPVGEYNSSRILKNSSHVTHYLNGELLLEYELWSDEWEQQVADGKWKDFPDYGRAKSGKFGLQDHGNKTWFRNIKVRRI